MLLLIYDYQIEITKLIIILMLVHISLTDLFINIF